MKKILFGISILGISTLAYCADVIPNECAFPAAKPLINAAFTSQGVSNGTYALKSTATLSITNFVGTTTNVMVFIKGVLQ
jgi:hypothetical protein